MSSGKYIPPAQRAGYMPSASSAPPPSVFTAKKDLKQKLHDRVSVSAHFGHPLNSTLTFFGHPEVISGSLTPPESFKYVPPSERRKPEELIQALSLAAQRVTEGEPSEGDPEVEEGKNTENAENAKDTEMEKADKNAAESSSAPTPLDGDGDNDSKLHFRRRRPLPTPHPLEHLVSYIFVFRNAHPKWTTDHELWTHTNAERLIADWAGGRKNFGRPIPGFFTARGKDSFIFGGWWIIESLAEVEPHSEELREMLQVKEAARGYSRSGRTTIAWQQSLRDRWIRLRLAAIPLTSEKYGELKDPMEMQGGRELEKLMLQLGGLNEEMALLEKVDLAKMDSTTLKTSEA